MPYRPRMDELVDALCRHAEVRCERDPGDAERAMVMLLIQVGTFQDAVWSQG